jgi:hypothetical protein
MEPLHGAIDSFDAFTDSMRPRRDIVVYNVIVLDEAMQSPIHALVLEEPFRVLALDVEDRQTMDFLHKFEPKADMYRSSKVAVQLGHDDSPDAAEGVIIGIADGHPLFCGHDYSQACLRTLLGETMCQSFNLM